MTLTVKAEPISPLIKPTFTPTPCLIEHIPTGVIALAITALRGGGGCSFQPGYVDEVRAVLLTPTPDPGSRPTKISAIQSLDWKVYEGTLKLTQTL